MWLQQKAGSQGNPGGQEEPGGRLRVKAPYSLLQYVSERKFI